MEAFAETLVLVWMGLPVGVCDGLRPSDNITAIKFLIRVKIDGTSPGGRPSKPSQFYKM